MGDRILDLLTGCFAPRTRKASMPVFHLTPPDIRPKPGPVVAEKTEKAVPRYNVIGNVTCQSTAVLPLAVAGEDANIKPKCKVAPPHYKEECDEVSSPASSTIPLQKIAEPIQVEKPQEFSQENVDKVIISESIDEEEETLLTPIQGPLDEPSNGVHMEECPDEINISKGLHDEKNYSNEPHYKTFEEAIKEADSDSLLLNFTPSLFNNRTLFKLPRVQKRMAEQEVARDPLNAKAAERLVDAWIGVAERRIGSGIHVCHLVDYFEDAIVQQFQ